MIRETNFLETVPKECHKFFVDECNIAGYKLNLLKTNLSEKFNSRVCTYSCQYSGIDETGYPQFKGLEENFAPQVMYLIVDSGHRHLFYL